MPDERADRQEIALLVRAGEGDRRAAARLIEAHGDRVFRAAYRVLGERALAEDAAQETFLRLWRSASILAARARRGDRLAIEGWLVRVARNVAIDFTRRRRREAGPDLAPEPVDQAPLPEERLVLDEGARALRAAVAALPERQGEAIHWRYFEGLSSREAGLRMGLSERAVESLAARAKRALRAALAERAQ